MRRAATAMLSLLLAACDPGGQPAAEAGPTSAGERIEQAARAQGVVPDPDVATLTGVWARDTDRLCIVDAPGGAGSGSGHGGGSGASGQRIGIVTDFGDGQGCIASGAVRRSGDALAVSLGRCRFVARLEEGRIVFPGTLPDACALSCRGRASLTGLDVERQSESASEAVMLRSRGGRQPCA